jgi:DNA-binding NarL/FixJ family response regulator
MNILILDDDSARHRKFAGALKKHNVWHAKTYEEFAHKLGKHPMDVVYLDYDLDLEEPDFSIGVDGNGHRRSMTGEDAARLLGGLPSDKKPRLVVIHSLNDQGAELIKHALKTGKIDYLRRSYREIFPKK